MIKERKISIVYVSQNVSFASHHMQKASFKIV